MSYKSDRVFRFTTDFTFTNKYILQIVHPSPFAWDVIRNSDPRVNIYFDFQKYHQQIRLDEEPESDSIIYSHRNFNYTNAPIGIISARNRYNQRFD